MKSMKNIDIVRYNARPMSPSDG